MLKGKVVFIKGSRKWFACLISKIPLLDLLGQNYGEALQADTHMQFHDRIHPLIETTTGIS
ncbi:hypothetical protein [Paenibacillus sp. NPDC055715]